MRQLVTVLFCVAAAVGVQGIFVHQEIRKVPVDRLAANIEKRLAVEPANIELRLNLARLHAMAYALKVTEFDALGKDKTEAWFGHMPPHVPEGVRGAPTREHQERARVDLARAIRAYADVIARAPNNAVAHLGHGWVQERAGDKRKAIDSYRRAIEMAWKKDQETDAFWETPVTSEAAERLQKLLDPVADAKEIASLEEKQAALDKKGRMITPIAIPLGQADRTPVDSNARVYFDADGSGVRRHWTWITSDAGWLVHDPGGAGRITSALQWFGNVTFWLFWENGYHALSSLDDNGDRRLSGPELAHLAIWQDANQDGRSDPGEVRSLSAHNIVALSCDFETGDDPWIAAHAPSGVTFADGTSRPSFDVILRESRRGTTVALNER